MQISHPWTQILCPIKEKLQLMTKENDKEHGPQLHGVLGSRVVVVNCPARLTLFEEPVPQHCWGALRRHIFTLFCQLQEHLSRPHFAVVFPGTCPILLPGELLQAPLETVEGSAEDLLETPTIKGKQVHNKRERQRLSSQTIYCDLLIPIVRCCTGHAHGLGNVCACYRVEDSCWRLAQVSRKPKLLHTDSEDAWLARLLHHLDHLEQLATSHRKAHDRIRERAHPLRDIAILCRWPSHHDTPRP
mmetsp:Transcript_28757/g.61089  ORF Transcript_28757/g.61089 Transcript_28757/m.61089 type:complete len:245 (+) Transcript_28757:561-1295(+)